MADNLKVFLSDDGDGSNATATPPPCSVVCIPIATAITTNWRPKASPTSLRPPSQQTHVSPRRFARRSTSANRGMRRQGKAFWKAAGGKC